MFVHLFVADYPDMLKMFLLISSVLRDRCYIFSNTFSSSKKYLHCFLIFFSVYTVNYIAWSSSDKPILHFWDKPCFFFFLNYIFQESIHSGLLLLFKISTVLSFSVSLISILIFIIFFLLLTLGLICSSPPPPHYS